MSRYRFAALVLVTLALSLSGVAPARVDHALPRWWHERAVTIEDRTGYGYVREATAQAVTRWNESGANLALEEDRVQVQNVRGKRKHWIRRDRLKPPAYRLVREAVG